MENEAKPFWYITAVVAEAMDNQAADDDDGDDDWETHMKFECRQGNFI